MELKRTYTRGEITWNLLTQPDSEIGDVSTPVQGTLSISEVEDMEYPLTIRIIDGNCDYIELTDWKMSIESPTDLPAEFNFSLSSSEERQDITIQINDDLGSEVRQKCPVRSSHVANLSSHILANKDIDKVKSNVYDYYASGQPFAFTLRKDARKHVGYNQYCNILNYLYKHDPTDHSDLPNTPNVKGQMKRSMIKHVVTEGSEYFAESMTSFESMLNHYEQLDYLPTLSNSDKHELRGYLQEVLAKEAAMEGNFQTANDRISESIKHFEHADRAEITTPAILKRYAIEALIKESNGEFEEAAGLYETAADEAEGYDSRVYEIWSTLSLAKQAFADGNYEQGKLRVEDIPEDYDDVNLVDLRKLTILVDLFNDYEEGARSEARRVFKRDELPYPPRVNGEDGTYRDITAQFKIDYTSAYSMLLNRQRISQLNQDPGINKPFQTAIMDGITPGGMDTEGKQNSTTDGGATVEENPTKSTPMDDVSYKETSSGLAKIQERPQDRTFEALDQDNAENITYESQVSDTQQGRYHHEKVLDTLEEYLEDSGLKSGETNWSDLIATDEENILLVEAKHISPDTENIQIRKAVGQLLEYRYRDILQDDEFAELDLTLWLLLAQPPSDSFKPILNSFRDKGIHTLWVHDSEIGGLEESLIKLEQITGE